jgi:hypothetical protein
VESREEMSSGLTTVLVTGTVLAVDAGRVATPISTFS